MQTFNESAVSQVIGDDANAAPAVELDAAKVFGLNGGGVQPIRDQSN